VLAVLAQLQLVQMAFLVPILFLVLLRQLVAALEVMEMVRQLLVALVVVLVLVLVVLYLEEQELQVKALLVVILGQVTMLEVVAVLVQSEKTSILLAVGMAAQAFVQP
jgi:hypothetical protein